MASPSDGVLGVAARVVLDASALWEGCCLAGGAFGGREGAEPVAALGLAAGCCDPDVPTWVDGSATGSISVSSDSALADLSSDNGTISYKFGDWSSIPAACLVQQNAGLTCRPWYCGQTRCTLTSMFVKSSEGATRRSHPLAQQYFGAGEAAGSGCVGSKFDGLTPGK